MKKIVSLILLLVLIMSFSACGNIEITMQEIYDASQTASMLENHKSVFIRDELNGEMFNERYFTKDYSFDFVPDAEGDWAEFMTDDACYSYNGGVYVRYLPITPGGVDDGYASYRAEYYASVILSEDTLDEGIESVSKKDGRISVTTVMSQKVIDEMSEFGVTGGKFEYVLDAKTREIIALNGDYIYDDGVTNHISTELSYDADAPELVKTFLEYANQTESLRSITVVTNPGTDKEISQNIQVVKGLIVGLRYNEEAYKFEAYTDAACTISYDPYADTDSDQIIYVKWSE